MPYVRILEEIYRDGEMIASRISVVNLNDNLHAMVSYVDKGFHVLQNEILSKNALEVIKEDLPPKEIREIDEGKPNLRLLKENIIHRYIDHFSSFIFGRQKSLIHSKIESKFNWKSWLFLNEMYFLVWLKPEDFAEMMKRAIKEDRDVFVTVKVYLDTGDYEIIYD